mgnify:CR=1 FL=1
MEAATGSRRGGVHKVEELLLVKHVKHLLNKDGLAARAGDDKLEELEGHAIESARVCILGAQHLQRV